LGFWRSVGHSYTAFVVESFIDEIAHFLGQDPYWFRAKLLEKKPRHLAVLNKAAEKAQWASPLPANTFRGIAQHASFRSFAAAVVEVKILKNSIKVEKVTVAIDCGQTINPDMIRAQLESAVVFGLSQALKSEITVRDGSVEQSNFHDFEVLRSHECPIIHTEIVDSQEKPTGVGEPGVPPIAPAVANAVFAATKQRYRKLPMRLG
jgi:CO/xanthine dehydrogenase Mo-binding subunit